MFVSHPQFEFPLPEGFTDPGSKHWRLVEFSLHTPWFLLTVTELTDEDEVLLTHTWCIAWARDLAQILTTVENDQVRGLVCMMPGWSSASRQWTSRELDEVWLVQTDDAEECVRFLDRDGEEFDGEMRTVFSAQELRRRRLLKVGARDAQS